MPKRASNSVRLWFLLSTTWALGLLLVIALALGLGIYDTYFSPPNIDVFLAVTFFNGLVLSSFITFPSLLGINIDSYVNLIITVLIGLAQWLLIYQLGRLWLLNWKPHKWYWRPMFPIFLVGYYAISGSLSIFLLAITVG
jgi:hypothetical protein